MDMQNMCLIWRQRVLSAPVDRALRQSFDTRFWENNDTISSIKSDKVGALGHSLAA